MARAKKGKNDFEVISESGVTATTEPFLEDPLFTPRDTIDKDTGEPLSGNWSGAAGEAIDEADDFIDEQRQAGLAHEPVLTPEEYYEQREERDTVPVNEPTSYQSRVADIILTAALQAEEQAEIRPNIELYTDGTPNLRYYPPRIAELRVQIVTLSEMALRILDPFRDEIIDMTQRIEEIRDGYGKAIFSNDAKRKIELERQLAAWPEYSAGVAEKEALEGAVKRLEIELDFIKDQFGAAKELYRRRTAELKAD